MPVNMFIVWLVLLVVLAVIEMATVAIVSVWFCFGVLVAMILSMMGFSVTIQVVAFVAVSTILLIFTRPIIKKFLLPKNEPTNADRIIGASGIVTSAIDNTLAQGTVAVGGTEWSARSGDGTKIPKGELVKIIKIEGVKVIVDPLKNEEVK